MANTVIQLKYSDTTAIPASLNTAEPAYSNNSNKLFIGQSDGSVVAIGGKYYTALIDAATSANTSSAIVKRGSDGGFSATYVSANLYGNANTATALLNGRNFEINGLDVESAAVAFDGTAGVVLQGNLKTTGVTAGTYGGASQIPVFTVDMVLNLFLLMLTILFYLMLTIRLCEQLAVQSLVTCLLQVT